MTISKKDSEKNYTEAFVWIWLPGKAEPVVAGKLTVDGPHLVFNYGKSYLNRKHKIPIYDRELPLQQGIIPLLDGLTLPGCIRDGSPDAWGRRVIINKKFGSQGGSINGGYLDELTYLLESGSDRIGALDFQVSPTEYKSRDQTSISLEELIRATELVERGVPLTPDLDLALYHGTAIGGARPKALIEAEGRKYIAKFSSASDVYSVIKAEYIAMKLAKIAGLNVASVSLEKASHKDVLLIDRFDRELSQNGWLRKGLISSLTLFELDEMMSRYASYGVFAEIIRHRFANVSVTLKEMFSRLIFNVLTGNTDDHARNHAAFWDGKILALTPAYDICPQPRNGREANQAMLIFGDDKRSRIATCLKAAQNFRISEDEVRKIVGDQVRAIVKNWDSVCNFAQVSVVDKNLFASKQFLNPYAFEDLGPEWKEIVDLAKSFHGE